MDTKKLRVPSAIRSTKLFFDTFLIFLRISDVVRTIPKNIIKEIIDIENAMYAGSLFSIGFKKIIKPLNMNPKAIARNTINFEYLFFENDIVHAQVYNLLQIYKTIC